MHVLPVAVPLAEVGRLGEEQVWKGKAQIHVSVREAALEPRFWAVPLGAPVSCILSLEASGECSVANSDAPGRPDARGQPAILILGVRSLPAARAPAPCWPQTPGAGLPAGGCPASPRAQPLGIYFFPVPAAVTRVSRCLQNTSSCAVLSWP